MDETPYDKKDTVYPIARLKHQECEMVEAAVTAASPTNILGENHESIALARFPPRPSDQQAGWFKSYCSRKNNLQNRVGMVGHLSPMRSGRSCWDLLCSLTSGKQVRGDQGIVWYLSWTQIIFSCWSSPKEAHLKTRVNSYRRQWWENIQLVMKKCYVSKWPWRKVLYPLF